MYLEIKNENCENCGIETASDYNIEDNSIIQRCTTCNKLRLAMTLDDYKCLVAQDAIDTLLSAIIIDGEHQSNAIWEGWEDG